MKRIFINKWFILASLLTISLSAFSFMAFHKTETACNTSYQCSQKANSGDKSEMLWDLVTRQIPSASFQ